MLTLEDILRIMTNGFSGLSGGPCDKTTEGSSSFGGPCDKTLEYPNSRRSASRITEEKKITPL